MAKKLNQSSFFEVEEDVNLLKKVETKVKDKVSIPKDYVPIHLDSLGKLEAPKILHFRNYVLTDIINLTKITDESKFVEALLDVLNGMVFEDFNCKDLHEKELEQIMVSMYISFWGNEIPNIIYFYNEELGEDEKYLENNIGRANIDIRSLNTIPMDEKFREPFVIKINDKKVGFRLPKFRNQFLANTYLEAKYFDEERKFSNLRDVINKNNNEKDSSKHIPIDEKELKAYSDYIEKKSETYLKVYQASLIDSIDGEKLALPEKIKALNTIDLRFWAVYEENHKKYAKYGIDPIAEVFDTVEKKLISRRLQFRSLDFLPSVLSKNSFEHDVIFDDPE